MRYIIFFICLFLLGCKGIDTIGGEPIDDREIIRLHMPTTFTLKVYLYDNNVDSINAGICYNYTYLDKKLFDVHEYKADGTLDYFQARRGVVVNNGTMRYCSDGSDDAMDLLVDDDKHIRFILLDSLNEEKSFDIDLNPLFNQVSKEDSVFTFSFLQNFRSIALYSYDLNQAPSPQCRQYIECTYIQGYVTIVNVNIALDTNRLQACDSENPLIENEFEASPPMPYLNEYQYMCPLIEVHGVLSDSWFFKDYCIYYYYENLSEYSVAIKDLYNPKRKLNETLEKFNDVIKMQRGLGSKQFMWEVTNVLTNQSSYQTDSIFLQIQYRPEGGDYSHSDSNTTDFPLKSNK